MHCLATNKAKLSKLLNISIYEIDPHNYKTYQLELGSITHKGGLHFTIESDRMVEFIEYLTQYGRIYEKKEKIKTKEIEKENGNSISRIEVKVRENKEVESIEAELLAYQNCINSK